MVDLRQDEGRAWLVLVAAFLGVGIITDGIGYAFGLIYTELLWVYDESNGQTSLIGSLQQASGLIFALPTTYLIEKQGSRRVMVAAGLLTSASFLCSFFIHNICILCITLGGLVGIGMNAIEAAGEIVTQRCFKTKRVLANGIATSGTGFGMLVMGPFIQWLLSFYGLTGTFLVLSGVTLNGVVFGFLIPQSLPDDEESTEETMGYSRLQNKNQADCDKVSQTSTATDLNTTPFSKSKEKINLVPTCGEKSDYLSINNEINGAVSETSGYWRLLKNMYYILYCIGGILTFTVTKAVIVFFPDRAFAEFGTTSEQVAILVTVLGATHIVARPLLGILGTEGNSVCRNQMIYAASVTLSGLITLVSVFFETFITQIVFVVIFGIANALLAMYQYPVLCDIINMCDLEKAFGTYHSVLGFVMLVFIPFSGWLVDITGNYSLTFCVSGITQILGAVFLFAMPLVKRQIKQKT